MQYSNGSALKNNNFFTDMIKCQVHHKVIFRYFKLSLLITFLRVDINEFPEHFCCNDLILVRNAQEVYIQFFRRKAVFQFSTAVTDMHLFVIKPMGYNLFIFGYGNRGLVLVIIFSTVLVMDIDVSCFLLRQKLFRAIARAQSTSIRCLRADAFSDGASARMLIRLQIAYKQTEIV